MPQLQAAVAQKVDEAEDGFKPIDAGVYIVKLASDVEVREGDKGPYWKWTFEIPEGEKHAGRKFFTNTSLSEAAFFKLKEAFAAFGVPTTTNTEDLVGKRVRAMIGVRTIQKGARAGDVTNDIEKLLPLDGPTGANVDVTKPGSAKGGSTDEPLF